MSEGYTQLCTADEKKPVVHLRPQMTGGEEGCLGNTKVYIFWLLGVFERHIW